jgi:hypothetical protein
MFQPPSTAAAKLLDFIARFEAPHGYDTVFGNNQKSLPQKLTSMKLNEVLAAQVNWTHRFGSSAAGRYQFMRNTLLDLKSELGLSGDLFFDAQLQDWLGFRLLQRRGYERFTARTLSLPAFGLNLAQEWASFPVLQPVRGASRSVARGQSFYAGDGLNRALVAPELVEAALNEVLTLERTPTTPTAKPETPMPDHPPAGTQAPASANNLDPKPWYLSKGVIGGAIAVAIPVLSLFVPALRIVDPTTATDWVMKAIQVGGPAIGGLLAILGRVQATQPIAGTAAATTVHNALAGKGKPVAGSATPGIWNLPLVQVIDELPTILDSLKQLGVVAAAVPPPIAASLNISPAPAAFPPSKDPPQLAPEGHAIGAFTTVDIEKILAPIQQTLSDIKTALASSKQSVPGGPAARDSAAIHSDGAPSTPAGAKAIGQVSAADIENALSPIEKTLADIKAEVTAGLSNGHEEQTVSSQH